jgi:predicted secreted protein with PEFG-CTERM motif
MAHTRALVDAHVTHLCARLGERPKAMLDRESEITHDSGKIRAGGTSARTRTIIAIVVMATLLLSAVAAVEILVLPYRSGGIQIPAVAFATTPHDPVLIEGNDGFNGPNSSTGIVRGSGTVEDPFMIEGWEISSFPSNGIEVRDADIHFVIQNCYVHDAAGWEGAAIYLHSCSNGSIMDSVCSTDNPYGNFLGIYLDSSSGNVVYNNTCSWNNQQGIYLSGSSNNLIENNVCSDNYNCLFLWQSDSNTLRNNSCSSDRGSDIVLASCQGNTLRENDLNRGIGIQGDTLSCFNTHLIDTTNTVNGKQIFYFKNETGIAVPSSAGQIILANCTGMEIDNQNLGDVCNGIELAFCAWTTITNSSCFDNHGEGIYVYRSDHTTIVNVTSSSNYDGVLIYCSTNATVRNCTFVSNGYGVYFENSRAFELSSSVFEENAMMLYVEECSDGCICNNTVSTTSEDYEYDFRLEYSSNMAIEGNVFDTYGLYIDGFSLEHFNTHEIPPNNYLAGKPILYYANTNNLEMDTLDAAQLFVVNCSLSHFQNLNLEHVSQGILAAYCDEVTFENCSCSNSKYGVNSIFCSNLSFSGCEVSGTENGFDFDDCTSVVIESCEATDNGIGISLYRSSGSTLSNNNCSSNNWYGMYLYSSDNNRIWNNTFYCNNGAGDTYDPAHIQACDYETGNQWNSTGGYGNYWSDWTMPDSNMDGVVDEPYILDGGAGARDYYPYADAALIPEFGVGTLVVLCLAIMSTILLGHHRHR